MVRGRLVQYMQVVNIRGENQMSITDKIANAQETTWVTESLSEAEIKSTIELAKISAKIEKCRQNMNMTQKEFAEYMNVSQGMISKWESREYNFTIKSLNEICEKLHLSLKLDMQSFNIAKEYPVLKWDEIKHHVKPQKKKNWIKKFDTKGAIA